MAKTLKASLILGGSMSSGLRGALGSTKTGLDSIGRAIENVERRQRLLGASIQTFGRQGRNVDGLRVQYDELTRSAERLRVAQTRLTNANAAVDANMARRGQLGGALAGASAGFMGVALPTVGLIKSAMSFETAMLGVAKQVDGARDAGGKLTPVYHDMYRSIQQLGHELPIANNEIAAMVTSASRMGVARGELIGFTRDVAMMATAFEAAPEALADSMGKIAGLYKIPITAIGSLADTINYLDDNAISKGADIIEYLTRVGGIAGSVKVTGREMSALGSTLLTLGERTETAGTATNAMFQKLAAADKGTKKFRAAVDEIGLSTEALQSGMQADAMGTMLTVLEAIGKLSPEKQMGVMTDLVGLEHSDTLAKLANNTGELRKQLEMANSEAAKGSMSREFAARMQTTEAQLALTKNRASELAVSLGSALLPAVNDLFQTVNPLVSRFADWARENPAVVKGVIGGAMAITGLRVAVLGLGFAWTFVKAPFLQVSAAIARFRAAKAAGDLGRLGTMAVRAAGAFRWLTMGAAAIGGGPVAAAIAALVVGALVVRRYWEPIKAFMVGMWDGMSASVGPALGFLMSELQALRPAWDAVSAAIGQAWTWLGRLIEPVQSTSAELQGAASIGRTVGTVLSTGFKLSVIAIGAVVKAVVWLGTSIGETAGWIVVTWTSTWDALKATVSSAVDWMLGKIQPLTNAIGWVFDKGKALGGAIGNAYTSGSNFITGGQQAPALAGGQAPPALPGMATSRGGAAATTVNNSDTYNITQQPGESGTDLARRIAEEQRRAAAVRSRGALTDGPN